MAKLKLDFFRLGDARSYNFIMTGSFSFLSPLIREEKKHLDVAGIDMGELAPQADALSIIPWPLGNRDKE